MTANVSRNGANAIMVDGTPEAMTNRALIANLIGAARLPAIYTIPEFVDAGHLMACSFDVAHQSAMAACFVFWREISRTAFWDFCNTIGTKRTF